MSCCGKKRSSATSRAIQQSKFNVKAKRIKKELCIKLEQFGDTLPITINNGYLYLIKPFINTIPANSALVSMGCAGSNARRLNSLCVEIASFYKHVGRKKVFESRLNKTTMTLKDLIGIIEFVKKVTT